MGLHKSWRKPYTFEELSYMPIEFAFETLTCNELGEAMGVCRSVAHQYKSGQRVITEDEISLVRGYIYGKCDDEIAE